MRVVSVWRLLYLFGGLTTLVNQTVNPPLSSQTPCVQAIHVETQIQKSKSTKCPGVSIC